MYNRELQTQVHAMFQELKEKSNEIIKNAHSYKTASDSITELVASTIASESEGYVIDMYMALTAQLKKEPYFQNAEHLNAFYRLNLREELNQKYHFEITTLDAYKKGIQFQELNTIYTTVGAGAGTLVVGSVLKFALSGLVHIPFIVIIAGAVAAALAAFLVVPNKNKKEFANAVDRYLEEMENEILNWLVEIETYFESRVRTLYSK